VARDKKRNGRAQALLGATLMAWHGLVRAKPRSIDFLADIPQYLIFNSIAQNSRRNLSKEADFGKLNE